MKELPRPARSRRAGRSHNDDVDVIMAKKRSVRVEETENKARAEIQAALLYFGSPFHTEPTQVVHWRAVDLGQLRQDFYDLTKKKPKNFARDRTISDAVRSGVGAGLKATRGRDQRHTNGAHSACSLVADELKKVGLHLSEDAVEKIWRASEKTK